MSKYFDLDEIKDGADRIVSFTLSEDHKTVSIQEGCDSYFSADFTKAEIRKLIDRLEVMHAQMSDE